MSFFADKVIPAFIFFFMAFILIKAFKTPLGAFKDWIVGLFSSGRERMAERRESQDGGMTLSYE